MLKPQLAEPIQLADIVRYCEDPQWFNQLKVDGHRRLIEVNDRRVTPFNRRGEKTDLPRPITRRLSLDGDWIFDGELVGDELWLFDLPRAGHLVCPSDPFRKRLDLLESLFEQWGEDPSVRLLPCYRTHADKVDFVRRALLANVEGIIFRRADGMYHSGRRTLDLLKAKFWRDVDCVVTGLGIDGKANMSLGVYDGVHPEPIDIGEVTALAADGARCKIGDVVTVRYLYFGVNQDKPRLYQPNLPKIRTDKSPRECTIDQLVHANKEVVL